MLIFDRQKVKVVLQKGDVAYTGYKTARDWSKCLKAWKTYFYISIYLVTCYDVSLGHLRGLCTIFSAVISGFTHFLAKFDCGSKAFKCTHIYDFQSPHLNAHSITTTSISEYTWTSTLSVKAAGALTGARGGVLLEDVLSWFFLARFITTGQELGADLILL